jgi:hypothetical protein
VHARHHGAAIGALIDLGGHETRLTEHVLLH